MTILNSLAEMKVNQRSLAFTERPKKCIISNLSQAKDRPVFIHLFRQDTINWLNVKSTPGPGTLLGPKDTSTHIQQLCGCVTKTFLYYVTYILEERERQ